ncbi:hypothetical protein BKA93DRAFT_745058 [Sparassis latifolia]
MTLVWTLERILHPAQDSRTEIRVYSQPFQFKFQDIVAKLGLYHGELHDPHKLVEHIQQVPGEGGIDMVILGTCEVDLPAFHDALIAAWDARDDEHKFQLVCVVHNVLDTRWQDFIPGWSRRGVFRVVGIADHVANSFRKVFDGHADSPDPHLYTAGYEYIPADVHMPVLDIPDLPTRPLNRTLSKAVVQGTFSTERRDYEHIFGELIASLHEDPHAWGYLPLDGRASFVPDPHSPEPPFQLAIVGSGDLDIPTELAYLATIYRYLDYSDFYVLISEMDIVVPAFAEYGYFEYQASSTVAMAAELNVPILATQRMRKAYGYIDDDTAVVTRPAAMREVQALKALRTGNTSFFLDSQAIRSGRSGSAMQRLKAATEKMVQSPWTRDKKSFARFKNVIWSRNQAFVERLLRDA